MFQSQRIDLSLGGDELRKSPKKRFSNYAGKRSLCICRSIVPHIIRVQYSLLKQMPTKAQAFLHACILA